MRTFLRTIGICGGPFIIGADMLSIGVAIGPMSASLDASLATTQWFMSGYGIGVAAFLVAAGKLADAHGARNLNRIGLIVYAAASALMALASDSPTAVAARLLQGIGGAIMISSSLGIAGQRFEGQERARLFSLIMAMAGLGMGIGPLAGGLLIHLFDWRAIFWINVPVCLLWIANNTVFLERDLPARRRPFDVPGLLLLAAAVLCLTVALGQGPEWGWTSPGSLCLFAALLVGAPLFVLRERRAPDPLLRLEVFRVPRFVAANLPGLLAYSIGLGWLFLYSLYLHRIEGYSPLRTGFALVPYALFYFLGGIAASRLGPRIGWPPLLAIGSVFLAAALLLLAAFGPGMPTAALGPLFALVGAGYILTNNASMSLAHARVPADLAGTASGVSMMFRWLAAAVGIACMTIVLHATSVSDLRERIGAAQLAHSASAHIEAILTDHGSWESQLGDWPAAERDRALRMLRASYAAGVDRGLWVLAALSLVCAASTAGVRRKPPRAS